ncbi:hypothetical protein ACV56Z_07250 [Staphylococcus aureus]
MDDSLNQLTLLIDGKTIKKNWGGVAINYQNRVHVVKQLKELKA